MSFFNSNFSSVLLFLCNKICLFYAFKPMALKTLFFGPFYYALASCRYIMLAFEAFFSYVLLLYGSQKDINRFILLRLTWIV